MNYHKKSSADDSFLTYCLDLLAPTGNIRFKKMFGGYGLYNENLIFGIIVHDRLYLKVDTHNLTLFEQHDSQPFTYERDGKTYRMSYYEVPLSVLENHEQLELFVQQACNASLRAKQK